MPAEPHTERMVDVEMLLELLVLPATRADAVQVPRPPP